NLREEHGYTYGARSSFVMGRRMGYFTASSSVQTAVTGPAVGELLKELRRIRTGDIAATEVETARRTMRTETIHAVATLSGVLGEAVAPLEAGLPVETITADYQALSRVTASELNQQAPGAIRLDEGVLVLVGDKEKIAEQLKPLELPEAVEVTA